MIRIALERMALFALPFVLFASYMMVYRRQFVWPRTDTPWFWLSACGLVLVILSFLAAGLWGSDGTRGAYVPPAYVHGQIVPGHIAKGSPP